MKKLHAHLSQQLSWVFKKKKIQLTSNDEVLLELREEKHNKATFEFDEKKYSIRNLGFWNPKTVIEKEGGNLLVFTRQFLGNKGKIEFVNGQTYLCKVRNFPWSKCHFIRSMKKKFCFIN